MKKRKLIAFISIAVTLAGLLSAFAAIKRMENYVHWVGLVLISGMIGLAMGIMVIKRINAWQEKALLHHLREEKFSGGIPFAFIGFGLLLGTLLNERLSTPKLLATVVEEKVVSHSYKRRVNYYIVVRLNGNEEEIDCGIDYWYSLYQGQHISVRYFDSPLGCDFLELPGDRH